MNARSVPRIVLADEQPLFLAGLRAVLSRVASVDILAETEQEAEVPGLVSKLRASMVLLGLASCGMGRLEVLRRLQSARGKVAAIVFTAFDAPASVEPLLRAGVRGCLLRHAPASDLLRAIELVHKGGSFFSPEIADALFQMAPQMKGGARCRPSLTPREREVLAMVADGYTTKRIAAELRVSERTALSHRENLMGKLRVHNVAGLTRHAVAQGLVPVHIPVAH